MGRSQHESGEIEIQSSEGVIFCITRYSKAFTAVICPPPTDRWCMVLMRPALWELSDAENRLAQALPPELQALMERVTKAQGKVDIIMAETNYIDGFRTGARLIMEILDDTYENLKPLTE